MIDVINYPSPEAAHTTAVYAVGDIHGRLDLLQTIERLIVEDIAETRPERAVVCYLGDYIDRGPQSAQVLEHLSSTGNHLRVALPHPGAGSGDPPARVFLKGNHEDHLLAFLAEPEVNGMFWLKNGGRQALASYGLAITGRPAAGDWVLLRDKFEEKLPVAHVDFLRTLRLLFVWREYVFVHAGLNPERPMEAQDAHDLMWIREPFLSSPCDWPRRVVHGHVVVPEPVFRANRIGIDTGASRTGRLTCLVLSDGPPRLLQTEAS